MILCSYSDKILIHLYGQDKYLDSLVVPQKLSQSGIAEYIDSDVPYVNRLLKKLKKNDLVRSDKRKVSETQRKRKVYFLTDKGKRIADKLISDLEEEDVTLIKGNEEREVKIRSLDEHLDVDNPIMFTLNNMDEEDRLIPEKIKTPEKDIFVDREEEKDSLKECLDIVRNHGARTIFIKGKAGVGKTRFVMDLESYFKSRGFKLLVGKSYYDTIDPYHPFNDAFEKILDDNEKKNQVPGVNSSSSTSKETRDKNFLDFQRRAKFYESTKWVKKIASEQPLVVFLDNLQWSDNATLRLLHYMTDNLGESPVLFIGSYRPEEVFSNHPLMDIKRRMSRRSLIKEIDIDRFDLSATQKIIESVIGVKGVPEDFVDKMYEETEGNPLYIKRSLKTLLEAGKVDPLKNKYPKEEIERINLKVFRRIIKRRVERLPQKTKNIIQVGSVIGEKVDLKLLSKVLDKNEFHLLDIIDTLLEADLWYDEPSKNRFSFSHKVVHDVVYENINKSKRIRVHKKTAESLKELEEDHLDEYFAALGYHYEKSRRFRSAMKYYQKGAEKAKDIYANEDALKMYEKALDLEEKVSTEDSTKISLLENIGDVHKMLGRYEAARNYYNKALKGTSDSEINQRFYRKIADTWEEQSDVSKIISATDKGLSLEGKTNEETCKLLKNKGWAYLRKGEYEEAYRYFEEEKEIAENLESEEDISRALHDLGTLEYYKNNFDKAVELLKRSIDIRKDIGLKKGLSASLNNLGMVYLRGGDQKEALNHWKEAYRINEDTNDRSGMAHSLHNIGIVYLNQGNLEEALDNYEKSIEIRKKIGDRSGEGVSLGSIGNIYVKKGEIKKGLEYYEEALSIFEEIGDKLRISTWLANKSDIYIDKGELDKAEEHLQKGYDRSREIGNEFNKGFIMNKLGVVYRERGELSKSIKVHKDSIKMGVEIENEELLMSSKVNLADDYLGEEKVRKADDLLKGLEECIKEIDNRETVLDYYRVTSKFYRIKEELEKAEERLESAVEIADNINDKRKKAILDFESALLLKKKGEVKRAKDVFQDAFDAFESMGLDLWSKKVSKEI
ncbi:MAG: tetratricopeptide repeat protein [Candidatus Saliniplasma sp.]